MIDLVEARKNGRGFGDDLRSQDVTVQVPSALAGLTAGFEMGPGVPPPPETPKTLPSFTKIDCASASEQTMKHVTNQRNNFSATTGVGGKALDH